MTTTILEDPLRRELKAVFENFGDHESVLVSRWYPQSRLYNWVYRYGWKASIKREGDYWRVTRTGGEGRAVDAQAPPQARLRQGLDDLGVGALFDCEGFTRVQAATAANSIPDKCFRLQGIEGGGFGVLREN